MNLEGGCSCGAIRYQLTRNPLIVHACHCRDCQRVTGSGFVINIWIEREFVKRTGATPKSVTLKGGTGQDHDAFFCDKCGTYVWSRYHIAPGDALFVRAGTLDNPDAVKPDVHIFTRSKLPWLRLPEGALAFETAYSIENVWPAESKERLRKQVAAGGRRSLLDDASASSYRRAVRCLRRSLEGPSRSFAALRTTQKSKLGI